MPLVINSSIPQVVSLFPGYIEGIPVAWYGEGEAGKSIFMLQEAAHVAKCIEKNVLIVGTEGGEDILSNMWFPVFQKRFSSEQECYVIYAGTMEELLQNFGKKVQVDVSEKGKTDIKVTGKCKNTVAEFVTRHNIGVVVVDSLTMPFRTEFAGGRMNFSGRADAQCLVLGEVRRLAERKIFPFVSHHATVDPTNVYAKPSITGGKNILHNFKISLYIMKSKSTNIDKMRRRKLYLTRYFNKQGWKEFVRIQLTDDGFVFFDQNEEEERAEKEKAEKEAKKEE